ncbi:MAG: hypothetical protein IPN53_07550 [Comamonadaceae bacterium]|nr:hypothetical protein [Comamonadaceae bacterium]
MMFSNLCHKTRQSRPVIVKAKRATRWLPFIASLALAACATVPSGTPEEQVRARAMGRWQALVEGDAAAAYSFITPGYRAVVPLADYRRTTALAAWYGAEVISVTCPEAEKCLAKVRIDFRYVSGRKAPEKISTHYDETWLLEAGQWWFFQKI